MKVLARIERVGEDVVLYPIRPGAEHVQVSDGDEFVTLELTINPWES